MNSPSRAACSSLPRSQQHSNLYSLGLPGGMHSQPHCSVPDCPMLQAVPCVLRRLSLGILEETSSRRTVPERLIYPSSILPFLHQAPRTCLSQDPQLQATAELPLLTGQTESHMPWSYSPMEPQHPSPGRAAFIAANKQKHHVLAASLKAPSSFCSWGCKFFKLIWSESMIQHENSLFTQSPAVTPRLTVQGEQVRPCSNRESSLQGSKSARQPAPPPLMARSTGKASVLILVSTQNQLPSYQCSLRGFTRGSEDRGAIIYS